MYVYLRKSNTFFQVGFYTPGYEDNKPRFFVESDHGDVDSAAKRVIILTGVQI